MDAKVDLPVTEKPKLLVATSTSTTAVSTPKSITCDIPERRVTAFMARRAGPVDPRACRTFNRMRSSTPSSGRPARS